MQSFAARLRIYKRTSEVEAEPPEGGGGGNAPSRDQRRAVGGEGSHLQLYGDVLAGGEGLGHLAQDVGGRFGHSVAVLPQQPED